MGKVIPFPTASTRQQLEKAMSGLRSNLRDMYDALDRVERGYKIIEDQTHETESNYQELMQLYIDEVGEEEVPFEWLEFCPYVGMERDPETGKIKITLIKMEVPEYEK